MAAETAKRNVSQRAIRNLLQFVTNNGHMELSMTSLKDRVQYLDNNWDDFRESHILVASLVEPGEVHEQDEMFDAVEKDYLATLNILRYRLTYLEEEQQIVPIQQHEPHPQENNLGSNNPDQMREPEQNNGEEQNPNETIGSDYLYAQPQQQIIVQCGGMSKVENTWGEFDGPFNSLERIPRSI